jgi:hypothetical protein
MSTRYLCYFQFRGKDWTASSGNGPREFSEGFWIDENYQFTKGMDAKFWIPPHQIHYIEAIRSE